MKVGIILTIVTFLSHYLSLQKQNDFLQSQYQSVASSIVIYFLRDKLDKKTKPSDTSSDTVVKQTQPASPHFSRIFRKLGCKIPC